MQLSAPEDVATTARCIDGWDYEIASTSSLSCKPLVSVAMATYQHAAYIRKSIDSVAMRETDCPVEGVNGHQESFAGPFPSSLRGLPRTWSPASALPVLISPVSAATTGHS